MPEEVLKPTPEQLFINAYAYTCEVIGELVPNSNPEHVYPYPQLMNLIVWLRTLVLIERAK